MLSRAHQLVEHLWPILNWLAIHFHDDMPNDRGADPFVRNGKVNVRAIAAVEFEDWPYRRAHLLALNVGGIRGDTQRAESDKSRDDCIISAGAARLPLFRHGADPIAGHGFMSIAPVVN